MPHREQGRGRGMTLNERKLSRLVGETSCALVANESGFLPQQQQIEIAIVVVIEPHRLFIGSSGQLRRMLLENAAAIVIERRAGIGQHTKIRQSIVVEIARRYRPDIL